MLDKMKSRPCAVCGRTFPPAAMVFEYLPGCVPSFPLAGAWSGRSREAILDEATKCVVVCSNCRKSRAHDARGGVLGRKYLVKPGLYPSRSKVAELPAELQEQLGRKIL